MNEQIYQRLIALNRAFYEQFAASFAATRGGAQPGYARLLSYFPSRCQVLDLGCGNGRFARFLDEHLEEVTYVGVDGSTRLIELARQNTAGLRCTRARFLLLDLAQPGWEGQLAGRCFHVVVALAVLHHIPGRDARAAFVRAAASCLKPGGYLVLSNWRFLHNERMRRKIVPWERIGLSAADVEPGDYLLNWKREGVGYRYVHALDEEEVVELAARSGLRVVEQFHSDGREGDLSLYSVLRCTTNHSTQGETQ